MDEEPQSDETGAKGSVAFQDVPVELTVSVGHARISVRDLLALDRNAVIELDQSLDEPVSIIAGEKVVAYGELQELAEAGALGVRITRIADDQKEV